MYCNHCRQDQEEGSRYCCGCGRLLPVPLAVSSVKMIPQQGGTVPCTSCHAKSLNVSRFCWNCGAALAVSSEPTPAAIPEQVPHYLRVIMQDAQALAAKGELEKACNMLFQAVESGPACLEAQELLGDLYMAREMHSWAARAYDVALDLSPGNARLQEKLNRARGVAPAASQPAPKTPAAIHYGTGHEPMTPDEAALLSLGRKRAMSPPWSPSEPGPAIPEPLGLQTRRRGSSSGWSWIAMPLLLRVLMVAVVCGIVLYGIMHNLGHTGMVHHANPNYESDEYLTRRIAYMFIALGAAAFRAYYRSNRRMR